MLKRRSGMRQPFCADAPKSAPRCRLRAGSRGFPGRRRPIGERRWCAGIRAGAGRPRAPGGSRAMNGPARHVPPGRSRRSATTAAAIAWRCPSPAGGRASATTTSRAAVRTTSMSRVGALGVLLSPFGAYPPPDWRPQSFDAPAVAVRFDAALLVCPAVRRTEPRPVTLGDVARARLEPSDLASVRGVVAAHLRAQAPRWRRLDRQHGAGVRHERPRSAARGTTRS